jgi:hypothetical protein
MSEGTPAVKPKAALIFPTLGLDIGMERSGLDLAWSLGPSAESFITKGLARIYKQAPAYSDLVNFPYNLKAEDLQADIWLTGNALPCTHALRRVRALGVRPSYVVAHLSSLNEVPALVRAWRETRLFAQIEWVSEPCWLYACHVDQYQHYLCGTLKSAREFKLKSGQWDYANLPQSNDLISWGYSGSWTGPLHLDPKGDDGHQISIVSLFRSAAASRIVSSLVATLSGCKGIREYDESNAFAKFKLDDESTGTGGPEKGSTEMIVKLTDGGVQRLLDGSLENFYDLWPLDGCCRDDGLLLRRERAGVVPAVKPLSPFISTRNIRYMAAVLGIPDYWLPT